MGGDFGGSIRNIILEECEYHDDALTRPGLDLSYDSRGGYVPDTAECLTRLGMIVPYHRMGPEVRENYVPRRVTWTHDHTLFEETGSTCKY